MIKASIKYVNEIMSTKDIKPLKKFGQNFIIDKNTINKIITATNIKNDDIVLEIGPGLGALTEGLFEASKNLTVVEIDNKLAKNIKQEFPSVEVINDDFLKVDLSKFDDAILVGNLPYYITSAIIFKIFEDDFKPKRAYFMMQKEVAERICSKPGDRNYNNLSMVCQYYSECNIVMNVGTNVFIPKPKVESSIVEFVFRNEKIEKGIIKLIKQCFSQPRKTLYNNLRALISQEELSKIIDPSIRPNNLKISDIQRIYEVIKNVS